MKDRTFFSYDFASCNHFLIEMEAYEGEIVVLIYFS